MADIRNPFGVHWNSEGNGVVFFSFKMNELPPDRQFVYERRRISYDQENRVLEVMISIDRGDFFQGYQYRIVEEDVNICRSPG